LSRRPVANGDLLLDLLHDLQVQRPLIALGDDEHSVYAQYAQ
jgi:hypothetical protein